MLLVLHQRDHRVVAVGCELARMTVRKPDYIAGELYYRCLHSEADSEKRKARFARISDCFEHALHAAHSEPAWHEHAVEIGEQLARLFSAGE